MIVYLDTSALVPLLVAEPTSDLCGVLWDRTDRLVSTRLTHVEAAAALAMAERLGRITSAEHQAARELLGSLWQQLDVVELDERLMLAAAQVARTHDLRGYDAVHCAAAVTLRDESTVGAAGDQRLLGAWRAEGLAVVDTGASS